MMGGQNKHTPLCIPLEPGPGKRARLKIKKGKENEHLCGHQNGVSCFISIISLNSHKILQVTYCYSHSSNEENEV